jgi:hypothetical protein
MNRFHSSRRRAVCARWLTLWLVAWQTFLLPAQPASTNRVLELDGNGSYVQLPDNIFHDFTEGTVEAWVNWRGPGGPPLVQFR